MKFLSKEWSIKHLKDIKNKADKRYTPELNVELPISDIFDGLGRTNAFYMTVQSHYGKLFKSFKSITTTYRNGKIQRTFNSFALKTKELLDLLGNVKKYNTNQIPWKKINSVAEKAQSYSWKLSDQIRKEKEKPAQKELLKPKEPNIYPRTSADIFNSDLHDITEVQRELRFFIDLSISTSAETSNKPFLFINGLAGSGKTHLLCDLVSHRIDSGCAPTVLSFGEFFENGDDIWSIIAKQFGLDSKKWNKDKILKALDNKGKSSKSRSILMIDALNESRPLSFWNNKLKKLLFDIRKHPNIALVVTIRSGFEKDVINENVKKLFAQEEHRGFEFQEWEAVTRFFKEFSLPLPEIPLLTPEFQNPLFLLLFCRAFENTPGKKSKKSFKGHEGATHIFEKYVDSVSKKIEKKFKIDHGPGKNIWDTVIEKIAEQMVNKNVDRLLMDDILTLIKKAHPTLDENSLLDECEKNFLLVKVPHYVPEIGTLIGFDYRFPFQRFSDHLVGRFLFKKYVKEFGKTNKNISTATKFFSKKRKLGKFLSLGINRGIIEALSIQCPEQLKGVEFFEVAPYINDYLAKDAFVQSITWRQPAAFSADLKKPLEFINRKVLAFGDGNSEILNAFLSVSAVPSHPFNAEFLHKHLMRMKMPARDAWWSVFLHDEYKNRNSVDRLLKWSWSDQELSHLTDDSVFLTVITLTWFLTTTNRFIRDKATKGLVTLLQNRLHLVKKLLEKFDNVDDPYITERLLAVAYGSILRNRDDTVNIKTIAIYVYKRFFSYNRPPVHALIRDYARVIVEVARLNKINFRHSVKNTEPPYQSTWPTKIPSKKTLNRKYNLEDYSIKENSFRSVWSSLTFDDFGRYEIESHLSYWSGRKLNAQESDKKELYKKFTSSLNKKQNDLLSKATNPFLGINISKLMNEIKFVTPGEKNETYEKEEKMNEEKAKKERKKFIGNFKSSLITSKRRYFETEIEPFLDNRGSIEDPHERFDTSLAQRWIFNRVIELGYNPKIHGQFDNRVNRYDSSGRSNHKAERIGKKYQWIALHEFTALVADHFEFTGRYWGRRGCKYKGTWNPYIRDIDPSLLIQNDNKIKAEAEFKNWNSGHGKYDGWLRERGDTKWLQKKSDLPDPREIIKITDDVGRNWVTLKGIFVWQQETPPEREKYDYPTRELFYILKSFIIKKKDLKKITNWITNKGFGNWLPESNSWYETFIGEFPNSSSFEDMRGDFNIWTKASDKPVEISKIPIVVTDDCYLNEFTLDCSRDESISMALPSKFIVNKMNLKQPELDGRFRDKKGKLIMYATSVSEENTPSALIADKQEFLNFLNKNDYAVFWTLLAEKQFIGGSRSGREGYKGRLEIAGVYHFDSSGNLKGKMNSKFDSPKRDVSKKVT